MNEPLTSKELGAVDMVAMLERARGDDILKARAQMLDAAKRLQRREYVMAQHGETGRYWSGPREDIPPRFEEVPERAEGGPWRGAVEPPDDLPAGYLHEVHEPDKEWPMRMYSASSDNPWGRWVQKHLDRCTYKCTVLYARPAQPPKACNCLDIVNALIKPGQLQGNGCDETAQRNGIILAANALFATRYPLTKPAMPTPDCPHCDGFDIGDGVVHAPKCPTLAHETRTVHCPKTTYGNKCAFYPNCECGAAPSESRKSAMRVNIENMLRQIGASASKKYGYEYMLQEFTKHLRQLRDRSSAGPSEALKACDEFFALYVFSDNQGDERAANQSTERNT